ncbi:hypothetical protein ACVENA_11670 [Sphingopyxis sp. 550A]
MLEADEIERLAIDEIGGGAIVGHLALPDCLADGWRKFVVAARLDHRDNGRIRNLAERADREFEVGREGGYAAAAREGIADERDPQRRRVQAISVLAFRFGGHFHRRRLLGGKGSECFGFCCLGLADLAIAALLRFCHVRRPSFRSSDTRIRPNAAGGPKRSLRSGHSEKDRDGDGRGRI